MSAFLILAQTAELPLWLGPVIVTLVKIIIVIAVMLFLVSYSVMAERKVCAFMQDRMGPNRTGIPFTKIRIWGLGQPIADAVKFLLKEQFTPNSVNKLYFYLAPPLAMMPAIITISAIPFASLTTFTLPFTDIQITQPGVIANINVGVVLMFAVTSLSVYGIVMAGWASNSKYPFLGSIRSSAQMISYEVSMGLSVIPIFMITRELNLSKIIDYQSAHGWLVAPFAAAPSNWNWQSWALLPCVGLSFLIFLIASFAETNRLPFDLPESEQELVGGYHTEYGGMKFALFFLGEYAAMIVASCLMVTLFLGGWSLPFSAYMNLSGEWYGVIIQAIVFLAKMALFIFLFIWVRWTLPRFRYDQLMHLGWVVFLPLALANILLTGLIVALISGTP